MPNLLVVHHSPSPRTRSILDAVLDGTKADGIEGVSVRVVEALDATIDDVLTADGYLLGTPANLGYMSGALKHFFDTIYNDAIDATRGRPFSAFLHGRSDTDGAALAITKITTGLEWRLAQPFVSVIATEFSENVQPSENAEPLHLDESSSEKLWQLGAAFAAGLMPTP